MKHFPFILLLVFLSFAAIGQELVSYSMSDCDNNSFPEYIRNRIISKELTQDTLKLSIGFSANCCLSPKPVIDMSNDTLYIEVENKSKMYCACDCCFELNLVIKGFDDSSFVLVYEKKKTIIKDKQFQDSMTYEILTYSANKFLFPTVQEINSYEIENKLNEYGCRIGRWRIVKNKLPYFDILYSEDITDQEKIVWSIAYDTDGGMTNICSQDQNSNNMICASKKDYDKLMQHNP